MWPFLLSEVIEFRRFVYKILTKKCAINVLPQRDKNWQRFSFIGRNILGRGHTGTTGCGCRNRERTGPASDPRSAGQRRSARSASATDSSSTSTSNLFRYPRRSGAESVRQLSCGPGNTEGGSITVPLTSCLTGLESAI